MRATQIQYDVAADGRRLLLILALRSDKYGASLRRLLRRVVLRP
jgi:hypothetical protein